MPARVTDTVVFSKWINGEIQKFTVQVAEETLMQAVRKEGFTTEPEVITDGVTRRDYHDVKEYGRIEFVQSGTMSEAVAWALDMLRKLSPVRTGRYRNSHIILLNGQGMTGSDLSVLDGAKPGDRVQIVNFQPYARKIEGQRARRRFKVRRRAGLSDQAPKGVYRQVIAMLQQRYGKTLFVDYKLERLELGGIEAASTSSSPRRKGGFYTYPVLQFYWKPPV